MPSLAPLHELRLTYLHDAGRIAWSRASGYSASRRARSHAKDTEHSLVALCKPGRKHFAVIDAGGTPLATRTTAADRNHVVRMVPDVDAVSPVRGKVGWPRRQTQEAYADRGGGHGGPPGAMRRREIRARIARRGEPHRSGLGNSGAWWSGHFAGCTASAGSGREKSVRLRAFKDPSDWRH